MVGRKKALQSMWKDRMTVIEYAEVTRPGGGTVHREVTVMEDIPCRLSFSSIQAANQNDAGAAIIQTVKLFCDSGLNIPAGSKIVVRRGDRTLQYCQSGEAALYTHHQEIVLVPFEEWT